MSCKGTPGIKLWLDDARPAPEGWTWVKNVEDAQLRLLHGNVEELSLDYDLDNPDCILCQFQCGHRDQGCSKNCLCHHNGDKNGADLLRWMINWEIWPKHKPVVHSTHVHAAEEMKQIIDQRFPKES